MNSIGPMNFFRTTDTTDTTIWKPGLRANAETLAPFLLALRWIQDGISVGHLLCKSFLADSCLILLAFACCGGTFVSFAHAPFVCI